MAKKADLPEYIIPGQWTDPSPDPVTGPRPHPYGKKAYRIASIRTGEARIYPDRDGALMWVLVEETEDPEPDSVNTGSQASTPGKGKDNGDQAAGPAVIPLTQRIRFSYRNWKGETGVRTADAIGVWYGATEWHPEPQWFLRAHDVEKNAMRDFAMRDMGDVVHVPR